MVWCTITVFQRKREVARKFNLTPPRDYHVKLGYDALFVNSTLTTTYGWHRSGRLGYRASPSHWWWRWPVVNRTVIRAHLAMQDRYTDRIYRTCYLAANFIPPTGSEGRRTAAAWRTDCCLRSGAHSLGREGYAHERTAATLRSMSWEDYEGWAVKKGFSFPPKKEEERRLSRHGEKKEAGKVRTYKHVYLLLITNGLYMDVPNP